MDWSETLSAAPAGWLRQRVAAAHGMVVRGQLRTAVARAHEGIDLHRLVIVGGTALGGSGKTPVVEWLARRLLARGAPVAIVGHGYGGAERTVRRACGRCDADGDEAVELACALPAVPLWLGRPRSEAIRAARASVSDTWVLVDGGLGARDVPWAPAILVDDVSLGGGRFPAGYRRLLPEDVPGDVLSWAHRIGEPGARPTKAAVQSRFRATGLRGPDGRLRGLDELRIGPWIAVSGVARPRSFHHALAIAGARVVEHRVLGDHAALSARILKAPPGTRVAITRKDRARMTGAADVWVLEGEIELTSGTSNLDAFLISAGGGR